MKNKNILLFLPSQNFNEEEFRIISTQLLLNGFSLNITSDTENLCVGEEGMKVKTDIRFCNIRPNNFLGFILVGGPGIRNYFANSGLQSMCRKFNNTSKIIGAICAAPVVLANAGLLHGKESACYTDDRKMLEKGGAVPSEKPVTVNGNIVTAESPQYAIDFSAEIMELMKSFRKRILYLR